MRPRAADSGPGRAAYVDSCIFWNNGPEANGTSVENGTGTFVNRQNTQLVVNNSIVSEPSSLALGTGNIDADPHPGRCGSRRSRGCESALLQHRFPGLRDGGLSSRRAWFPTFTCGRNRAARGSGFNGVDMGAMIPSGASISGEPAPTTWRTSAMLTVGGPDLRATSIASTTARGVRKWFGLMRGRPSFPSPCRRSC